MAKTCDLPQELLIEIFSRLPTKSVGKCRCLSKSWNSNLSTQEFIKLHFTRKPHQENLILITTSRSLHTISHPIQNDGLVSKEIELDDNWTQIVGSCNGLVLLVNKEDELWLINPITTQKVNIPDSDLALNKDERRRMHGFGYDSCSDDYKIVTLSYYDYSIDDNDEYGPDCSNTFVDVYSVKTRVWKRVINSPYDHIDPSLASGVFVNGAIHWLVRSREPGYRSCIAAFDLSSEVFCEIPAPCKLESLKFVFSRLVVLGGRLCILNNTIENTMEVCAMWEYGLDETWINLLVYCEKDVWDAVKPVCFIGEDELVLASETLVVYNMSEGTDTDMIVDGARAISLNDAGMFVDSLVAVG